ncbi:MAG TPA: hypothetical protein VGD49_09045 [Longimicrobiales bacterium]
MKPVFMVKPSRCVLLCALVLACARNDTIVPPDRDRISAGTWGGDNAGIIVEDSIAHIHIGCTLGNFPAPIALDVNGRFLVEGEYVLRAYPVQMGPALPARLSGSVDNSRLTFTVVVNDTVEHRTTTLGPTTVVYQRPPAMQNCPICRRIQR